MTQGLMPRSTTLPRILLISGASRGIGRAIAVEALSHGHRISLGLRTPADLEDTPLAAGERVHHHPYDAREPAAAEAWVASCRERFGGIDGVVHCAGVFSRVTLRFAEGEETEIDHLWRVNVMGPWHLTRAAWPALVASGDGRVIALVSMSGKRVKGSLAGYGASKFALMALCQSMRNEGWNDGIRVTAVCPSWVNTDMAAGVEVMAKQEMTQPGDLARLIHSVLAMPASCVPFELAVNCRLET
jgi:NAD(P)-dependent dehydrogenase (short-subunit alcohol dehydrogenase family)